MEVTFFFGGGHRLYLWATICDSLMRSVPLTLGLPWVAVVFEGSGCLILMSMVIQIIKYHNFTAFYRQMKCVIKLSQYTAMLRIFSVFFIVHIGEDMLKLYNTKKCGGGCATRSI